MVRWREGTYGWRSAQCLAMRCWRVDGQGNRTQGWLLAERPRADGTGRWKYYWSNFPPSVPLEKMIARAQRRHSVEQFHQVSKRELGWDQYQGRLWTGFHRHAILTLLAFSFLVWLEWRSALNICGADDHAALFPPRPACRRQSLAASHRYIAECLRQAALRELHAHGQLQDLFNLLTRQSSK